MREVLHGSPTMFAMLQSTFGVGLVAHRRSSSRASASGSSAWSRRVRGRGRLRASAPCCTSAPRSPAVAFVGLGRLGRASPRSSIVADAHADAARRAGRDPRSRVRARRDGQQQRRPRRRSRSSGSRPRSSASRSAGVAMAAVPLAGGLAHALARPPDAPAPATGAGPRPRASTPVRARRRLTVAGSGGRRSARRGARLGGDAGPARRRRRSTARLAELPGLGARRRRDPQGRSSCASFPAAIAFVVRIGFLAEATNHHPDLDIRWRTVHVALTTHDVGGLSDLGLRPRGRDRRGRRAVIFVDHRSSSRSSCCWRSRSSSAVAKDPGPTPPTSRSATSTRWDVARLRRRLPPRRARSCTTACTKAEWVAAQSAPTARAAFAPDTRRETRGRVGAPQGDAAAVVTRLTLRDGSVVPTRCELVAPVRGCGGRGLPASTASAA